MSRAQINPRINVTPTHVESGGAIYLLGTAFTPNRTVMSHLIRPDGSEYNPIRLRTDDHGEFSHKIDTTMLDIGRYDLWVEDEATKTRSNRMQFTVE
jgi:hypothetical protein